MSTRTLNGNYLVHITLLDYVHTILPKPVYTTYLDLIDTTLTELVYINCCIHLLHVRMRLRRSLGSVLA